MSLTCGENALQEIVQDEATDTITPSPSGPDDLKSKCLELVEEFTNGASDTKDTCDGLQNFYTDLCSSVDDNDGWPNDDEVPFDFRPQCCGLVRLRYETNCEESDSISDHALAGGVSLLLICVLVRNLIRKYEIKWMPEVGAVTLIGVIFGLLAKNFGGYNFEFFDEAVFMRVLLPPIIFNAALIVDKRTFKKYAGPIFLLAFPGTFLCSFICGYLLYGLAYAFGDRCIDLPIIEALTWGALISSIDPVATIGALTDVGMNHEDLVFILIFGESLLNDGVAVVLTDTLSDYLKDDLSIGAHEVLDAVLHFCVVTLGSFTIGILCGAGATVFFWGMYGSMSSLMEVLAFFFWALLPFWICDGIGWSGIVAIVCVGFVMDVYIVGSVGSKGSPHGGESGMENGMTAIDEHDGESTVGPYSTTRSIQSTMSRRTFVEHTANFESQLHLRYSIRSINAGRSGQRQRFSFRRPIFSKEGLLTDVARYHISYTSEVLASLTEMIIFLYLGVFLFSDDYRWNGYLIFSAIVACTLSRAFEVYLARLFFKYRINRWMCCRPRNPPTTSAESDAERQSNGPILNMWRRQQEPCERGIYDISQNVTFMLWVAGLRGAMSLALVEEVPIYDFLTGEGTTLKPELKAMTSGSIIFTIFVFGGSTRYLIDYLGLAREKYPTSNPDEDVPEERLTVPTSNARVTSMMEPLLPSRTASESASSSLGRVEFVHES